MSGYGLMFLSAIVTGTGAYALVPDREWVPDARRKLWRSEIVSGVAYIIAGLVLAFLAGNLVGRGL